MTGVEHHHVRSAFRVQVAPQPAPVALIVAEHRLQIGAARVPEVDHVPLVEAEHVQHVAPERLGVPMRVADFGDELVSVGAGADDHRHAVRVRHFTTGHGRCQECRQQRHASHQQTPAAAAIFKLAYIRLPRPSRSRNPQYG